MNKKYYQLLVVFLGVSFFLSNIKAQPQITFVENNYDFGTIAEKGGKVSHVFEFTNTGNSALLINRVRTSCGCTSPQWTRTPIEPGKKGSVKVTYNPNGRAGYFNKPVRVYSNASNEMVRLTIKGTVKRASNIEKNYPFVIGKLRLKYRELNFRVVNKGNKKVKAIEVYNNSSSKLTLSVKGAKNGFSVIAPTVLKPKEKGTIMITFDSNNTTEWGEIVNNVYLKINETNYKQPKNKIVLYTNVVEDFSKMTIEEKRKAPIAEVEASKLVLGKIKKGKKKKENIYIKNLGENLLKIRKVTNPNSNLTIHPQTLSVPTGKKGKLVIYIDTEGHPKGHYKKTFRVLTNDPINTTIVYTVEYQIV